MLFICLLTLRGVQTHGIWPTSQPFLRKMTKSVHGQLLLCAQAGIELLFSFFQDLYRIVVLQRRRRVLIIYNTYGSSWLLCPYQLACKTLCCLFQQYLHNHCATYVIQVQGHISIIIILTLSLSQVIHIYKIILNSAQGCYT